MKTYSKASSVHLFDLLEEDEEPIEMEEPQPEGDDEKAEEEQRQQDNEIIPEVHLHAIINLLLTELDFLLDDKVASEIEKEGESQQLLVKMNVLRKVLAVKEEGEMYRLLMDVYTKARRRDREDGKTVIDGASKMSNSVVEDPQANQPNRERNIEIDQYNAREFDANESQEDDFNDNVADG